MNRDEAVSLLREIMSACPSFVSASSVSLFQEEDVWVLRVMWSPDAFDGGCLENIVAVHELEVVTSSDGWTTFKSRPKN